MSMGCSYYFATARAVAPVPTSPRIPHAVQTIAPHLSTGPELASAPLLLTGSPFPNHTVTAAGRESRSPLGSSDARHPAATEGQPHARRPGGASIGAGPRSHRHSWKSPSSRAGAAARMQLPAAQARAQTLAHARRP